MDGVGAKVGRRFESRIGNSIAISAVSNPALTNRTAMVTSLAITPLLQVLLLVAAASSVGATNLATTALASIMIAFGLSTLTGTVAQVTRDRELGVAQDILTLNLWNWHYWAGKIAVPILIGIVPAVLSATAVLIFAHDNTASAGRTFIALLIVGLSGAIVGLAAAIFSLGLADPYLISNLAGTVLTITAGVVLPLSLYPTWLAVIARLLPFTAIIETLTTDTSASAISSLTGLLVARELLVSLCWFALAALASRRLLARIRSGKVRAQIW